MLSNMKALITTDYASRFSHPIRVVTETGAFYLGGEAKELGLVDVLGNREDAINLLKNMTGLREAELVKYELKRGFFDSLRRLSLEMFYFMGKGIGGNIKLISEKEFNLELR